MIPRNKSAAGAVYQTYPDGWGTIFKVSDRRAKSVKQSFVHFADSVVGERRFWDAKVLGIAISRAILVPYSTDVNVDDLFVINDKQYTVRQKQLSDRNAPASWLLSLEENTIVYRSDIDGNQG